MAVNDPLGDMLTRIRNAQMRKKSKVSTPGSSLRVQRARRAQERRLSSAAMRRSSTPTAASELEIELKYFDGAAGDPRDRAGVEAGPPGLCRR